jgi:shikimate dehydrogenase
VFGLLGDPVAHSLSPRLCNTAFAALDEDAVYVALPSDTSRPEAVIGGLEALGVAGVNVTYPLKTSLLPYLAEASPAVVRIGAANVLTRLDAGGFRGENTDAPGLVLAARTWAGWEPDGQLAAVLGAGGAARAAAHGLLEAGALAVVMLVRNPERATASLGGLDDLVAAGRLSVVSLDGADGAGVLAAASLVVQATPVGLDDPDAIPLVTPDAAPWAVGFELNYGPRPTVFARSWRDAGRACLDGRDLLAAQAHLALQHWLGRTVDLAAMRGSIAGEGGPR